MTRATAAVNHANVDPAALLVAVLTVGISPLTTEGAWNRINTIVSVVVLVVILAYTWPRKGHLPANEDRQRRPDGWVLAAQALVYGFIVAIGAGWPVQTIMNVDPDRCPASIVWTSRPIGCEKALNDRYETVTLWALAFGLATSVGLYLWMWVSTRRTMTGVAAPRPDRPRSQHRRLGPVRRPAVHSRRSVTLRRARTAGTIRLRGR